MLGERGGAGVLVRFSGGVRLTLFSPFARRRHLIGAKRHRPQLFGARAVLGHVVRAERGSGEQFTSKFTKCGQIGVYTTPTSPPLVPPWYLSQPKRAALVEKTAV